MSGAKKTELYDGVGYAAVLRAEEEIRERREKGEECRSFEGARYSDDMTILYHRYPNLLPDAPHGSFTIPDTVKIISHDAFEGEEMPEELIIPEGVEVISHGAFFACKGLRRIHIPASVVGIGACAFCCATELVAIDVDANNTVYSSADGVLFGKDMKDLCFYPTGKKDDVYRIPDSVETIWPFAFDREKPYRATKWELPDVRVIITDSVTQLCDYSINRNTRYIIACNEGSPAHDYAMQWRIKYDIQGGKKRRDLLCLDDDIGYKMEHYGCLTTEELYKVIDEAWWLSDDLVVILGELIERKENVRSIIRDILDADSDDWPLLDIEIKQFQDLEKRLDEISE